VVSPAFFEAAAAFDSFSRNCASRLSTAHAFSRIAMDTGTGSLPLREDDDEVGDPLVFVPELKNVPENDFSRRECTESGALHDDPDMDFSRRRPLNDEAVATSLSLASLSVAPPPGCEDKDTARLKAAILSDCEVGTAQPCNDFC